MVVMNKSVLVATLGGQPQVVPFAMDALLAQGESISQVILLHLASNEDRMQAARQKLRDEFKDGCYGGMPCQLRFVPLQIGDSVLTDIHNEAAAEAAWQSVRIMLSELKIGQHRLHLCVSGGRRIVALLLMSAAALLCDHHDRLWHMYTPDEVQKRARHGAIMHLRPEDGMTLIQVPLVPWGAYFPGLRAMAQAPQEAVAAQMGWLRSSERQCQEIYQRLTERQRDVLIAFANGSSPQDVAETLNITMATVNTHKTVILDECRIAWNLAPDARLDYRYLREKFAPFVRTMGQR